MKNLRKKVMTFVLSALLITTVGFNTLEAHASTIHTVKSGDSLWKLSRQYNVTINQIKSANNHWSDTIIIGQRLTIPTEGNSGVVSRGTSSRFNSSDIELMARTVHGEARGEEFEGQVAVAAVIINRINSSDFPNTVYEVVYQPWAFTVVHDGQINLTPNDSAYRAVEMAINGWDPTEGALYYFNPDTATSKWIWSRSQIKKIGRHIFAE